jgi:hypothetical protein
MSRSESTSSAFSTWYYKSRGHKTTAGYETSHMYTTVASIGDTLYSILVTSKIIQYRGLIKWSPWPHSILKEQVDVLPDKKGT